MFRKAYTFDDIALVPQYNNIPSRIDPALDTWITKKQKMKIPLLAANMDTVISEGLAEVLVAAGSYPIFHRFMPFEMQLAAAKRFSEKCYVSCGLTTPIEEVLQLLEGGALGVCIDVANGHCERMIHYIHLIKSKMPNADVIAGNVCTAMGYQDLVNAGADAVKVGIGAGAACTTRIVTGFGMPQFTAVYDCAKVAEKLGVPLIADGGIRNSRDVILALAAGASSVMIGKLFAQTKESAGCRGNKIIYRGQASQNFQVDYYGKVKEQTVPEGVHFELNPSGTAQELIDKLLGGLRSGMTYGGAKSLKELQRKAEFVEVRSSYMQESMPRAHSEKMDLSEFQVPVNSSR